eukprot:1288048-Prymnesium_polylepis.3
MAGGAAARAARCLIALIAHHCLLWQVAPRVGRAKLIELVDSASAALGKKREFQPAAGRLCQFVSNAGFTVNALRLGGLVGEVLYEGAEPRRRWPN